MGRKKGTGEKKEKKAKGDKKERAPWKTRVMLRLEKLETSVGKLHKIVFAAKPPGVTDGLSLNALTSITTLKAQLLPLAADWKPARGSTPGSKTKVGIGSVVKVKDGLEGDDLKVYKHVPKEVFANAMILDEESPKYWTVRCSDQVIRVMRKKHAAFAVEPPKGEAKTETKEDTK